LPAHNPEERGGKGVPCASVYQHDAVAPVQMATQAVRCNQSAYAPSKDNGDTQNGFYNGFLETSEKKIQCVKETDASKKEKKE
jgi:hypothetical protein